MCYMERCDQWRNGRVGLVFLGMELKPVLVFVGRKKIGEREIAWWGHVSIGGRVEANERPTD